MYRLKRDYGSPADIYFENGDTVDLTTGKRTVTKQKWHIQRAIPLPRSVDQKSVIAQALKEIFHRGGNVVVGDRQILIDRRDLPNRFVLGTENWYIIVDDKRYQVLCSEEYENQAAYIVTLKETVGAERAEAIELVIHDRIGLDEIGSPNLSGRVTTMLLHDNIRATQGNSPHALKSGTDVSILVMDTVTLASGPGGH
jgi:hypothetical protein